MAADTPRRCSHRDPHHYPRSMVRVVCAAMAGMTTFAAAACAAPAPSSAPSTATSAAPDTAGASYPMTVDNCGHQVTIDAPPQRILAIRSTSLEELLALGVAHRVVGKAFLYDTVPQQWRDEAASIPMISDNVPSQEPVLELAPDFIVAGWESNFSADGAGTREDLAKLGIATYVSPAACRSADQPTKLTYDDLFGEIQQLGSILGVPDTAHDLVAHQRAELNGLGRAAPGTTALWWSSATDTPYVGGGIGAPQMVMDAVGLDNVAGDADQTWLSMGWESIVAANPDVFVLIDSRGNSAQHKIDYLQSHPATAALPAVQQHRWVIIPFPAAEAGVRSVSAAESIVAQLGSLGLAP